MAGCATNRLGDAAGIEGRAKAAIILPVAPAWCRQAVAHASLTEGANVVSVLARERSGLDFANQRAANCWAWYDRAKLELEANPAGSK